MRFFKKFYDNVFFPYVIENDIKTIFHLGDIVDRRKFINYVTLNSFKEIFINPCIDNGIHLHVIVGNHDIPYRNTNEVNAMQELFGSKNDLLTIYSEPKDITFGSTQIAMIPWINNVNYPSTMEFIANTKAQVLFGHLEFSGFEMHRGMVNEHGLEVRPFDKFDMVCSGHFHHKSSRGNIHYLGNPYEMNWNDFNDQRGFHIIDSETRELTFIQNPYKIFYKVIYDDSETDYINWKSPDYNDSFVKVIVRAKNNPYMFDKFMDAIAATGPANISVVEENRGFVEQTEEEIINEAEDTLTTLNKAILNFETGVDKNKLSKLFSSLYVEAQAMEIE